MGNLDAHVATALQHGPTEFSAPSATAISKRVFQVQRARRFRSFWPAVPAVLLFVIAFVIPVLEVLVWSVYDGELTGRHYLTALSAGPYRTILFNTIELSVIVGSACVVIGYPVAYFLVTRPQRQQAVLILLILTPLWVSVLIRTYGWIVVMGREGLINSFLMSTGMADDPLTLLYTRGAVYVAMIQVLLPIAILIMFASMTSINRSLMQAARILGASPARSFYHVFLPLSMGGAVSAGLLTFILSLGFFITPALVGGPRESMIANIIVTQITQTLNWGFGSALGVILVVSGFLIVALVSVLARRFTSLSSEGGIR